jgi:diguanylate cyclase (GGDEF)-like protein/PAS domain S-box-containing protein
MPDDRSPADGHENIRAILNAIPAMVGYWDRELRNRMANDAYMEYFGRSPHEMRGIHISEVLGPEIYAKNRPYMERALAGEPQLFDREIPTPSGEVRYTQASYIPDIVDGEVRGFFVLVTDITERHRAEVELHASEERYRTLVEQLPRSAITLVDAELRLVWLGGGALRADGLDTDGMVGRPVRETAGGGDHGRLIESLYARALAGTPVSTEVHSRLTGRDFSVEIAPLHGPDGTVTSALGVAQDISDRKRAETALVLESQITENMAEGALLIRFDELEIVHANAAAERMFGYGPGALVGMHVTSLNAPVDGMTPTAFAESIREQVIDAGGTWSGEILSVRKDGSTFWRGSTVSTFEHPEHGLLLVVVMEDVTAQREHTAEEKALSAIATLVAEGAGPAAVFATVAAELRELFDAQSALVTRFDPVAVTGTVVGDSTEGGTASRTVDLEGPGAPAGVFRTAQPARVEVDGSTEIAAPVVVGGTLWGTVGAAFTERVVPGGTEQRLARFARLIALAIANAEAWDTLSRQAATDALTGLANHRTFHERLREELERARRYGHDLSLAMIDIDHFKAVNDVHGHQVGDRVLAEVARRISAQARDGEVVARTGGEEFAWLMPETSQEGAYLAAERVRRAIADEPFPTVGTVTVSAGVCSTDHRRDAQELVRDADRALYWAKESGRNRTLTASDYAGGVTAGPLATPSP